MVIPFNRQTIDSFLINNNPEGKVAGISAGQIKKLLVDEPRREEGKALKANLARQRVNRKIAKTEIDPAVTKQMNKFYNSRARGALGKMGIFGALPLAGAVYNASVNEGKGFAEAYGEMGETLHRAAGQQGYNMWSDDEYPGYAGSNTDYTNVQRELLERSNPAEETPVVAPYVYGKGDKVTRGVEGTFMDSERIDGFLGNMKNGKQTIQDNPVTPLQISPTNEPVIVGSDGPTKMFTEQSTSEPIIPKNPVNKQEDVIVKKEEVIPQAWTGNYGGHTTPEQFKSAEQLKEWQTLNGISSDGLYGDESADTYLNKGGNHEGYQNYLREFYKANPRTGE